MFAKFHPLTQRLLVLTSQNSLSLGSLGCVNIFRSRIGTLTIRIFGHSQIVSATFFVSSLLFIEDVWPE